MLFSRGVELAPFGSVQDRVMREMVFRERQERVAHMEAFAKIIGKLWSVDWDRVFGAVVSEYAAEVYQESYDADLLRRKIAARRAAQARVRAKRKHDEDMIKRLERMGEYYDKEDAKRTAAVPAPPQKPKMSK